MIMVRLLSTRAFMVGLAPPSFLGAGIVMESVTLTENLPTFRSRVKKRYRDFLPIDGGRLQHRVGRMMLARRTRQKEANSSLVTRPDQWFSIIWPLLSVMSRSNPLKRFMPLCVSIPGSDK